MLPPSLTKLNVDSPPTIHPDEPTSESSTILLSVIPTPEAELDTKMNDNKAENETLLRLLIPRKSLMEKQTLSNFYQNMTHSLNLIPSLFQFGKLFISEQ